MSDDPHNLTLDLLRAIRSDLAEIKDELHNIKVRMSFSDEKLAGADRQIHRLHKCVDSIEKRLGPAKL